MGQYFPFNSFLFFIFSAEVDISCKKYLVSESFPWTFHFLKCMMKCWLLHIVAGIFVCECTLLFFEHESTCHMLKIWNLPRVLF